jgi:SpoIIAA-like
VAAVAKGRVTKSDYDRLIRAVEAAFGRHQKVRCYYELGREFSGMDAGAMWEVQASRRLGTDCDRYWRWLDPAAINFFRFLVPGEIRIFPTSAAAEARRWIVADSGIREKTWWSYVGA